MSSLFSRFNRAKEQFRWLNYQICSDIEELCNGKIIELVDWPDFLNWFNLRSTEEDIVPKDKRKIEYLVHTLADYIDAEKDISRYGDVTIYPKWEKLDEEERLLTWIIHSPLLSGGLRRFQTSISMILQLTRAEALC